MSIIRVDFYLLPENPVEDKFVTACRLLEKAYQRGHRVFVACNDKVEGETLDELLWIFKEEAFIPHNLQGEGLEPPPPIQIAWDKEPSAYNDILLNLSSRIPPYFFRFRRIIEIVETTEEEKNIGRQHYRAYRMHACDMHTHHLKTQILSN